MNILSKQEVNNVSSLTLVNNSGINYCKYRIHFLGMNNSLGVTAVPTVLCSTNLGVSFDTGNHYKYYGFNAWYNQGIQDFDELPAQGWGVALTADDALLASEAASGTMDIYTPGVIGSVNQDTMFCSPLSVSVDSSSGNMVLGPMSGVYNGATGTPVNAFKIQASTQGAPGSPTISGLFFLEGILERN